MDGDSERPSELIGRILGEKYHLVRYLGGGGMGAVYEAEHAWTGRRVAVKLLRPRHQGDAGLEQRFIQEARAATAIQHPNIVQVFDMGHDGGVLYMVQELLVGRSLADELEAAGRLTPRDALDLISPVMGALVATHRRNILHRDLKPDNIFLAKGAGGVVPKLIDFGIAKMLEAPEGSVRTSTGRIIGTPAYMAPEQVRGDVAVDARVDVWALGVVLFQVLAGVLPFDGATANLVMLRIMTHSAPRLRDVAPDVPEALSACIDAALRADRDARYPSMQAFLGALLDCASTVPGVDALDLRARVQAATLVDVFVPDALVPLRAASAPPVDRFEDPTRVRTSADERRTLPDRAIPMGFASTEPLNRVPDVADTPRDATPPLHPNRQDHDPDDFETELPTRVLPMAPLPVAPRAFAPAAARP